MVHDVIADAAHDGSPKLAQTARASNDKRCLLLSCDVHDDLPWFAGACAKFPRNLKIKVQE